MNARYLGWIARNKMFDRKLSIAFLVFGLLAGFLPQISAVLLLLTALVVFVIVQTEKNPLNKKDVKKGLVLTNRVKRIRNLAWALYIIPAALSLVFVLMWGKAYPACNYILPQILLFQIVPLYIVGSNFLLSGQEKSVQNYFLNDAKRIMGENGTYNVGITGSYGKTSTKMVLVEIMNQTLAPTFSPPKSINTLMGVTAWIRNHLDLFHQYAICEMGAYKRGSIEKMCELVPPHAGIVTRIGIAHLERYGSQENIFQAKSELPRALPDDGILVCNGDDPLCRRTSEENPKGKNLLYGFDNSKGDLNAYISDLEYDKSGSRFKIHYEGKSYDATCKILGEPLLSNILASFTMACALGANPAHVVSLIGTLKAYDNRLELKEVNDGTIELHDAYNSNPSGFGAALDVLNGLKGQRKILITPGMVELGDREFDENFKIAEKAGSICDLVYVIGETNKKALTEGLAKGNIPKEKVVCIRNMKTAFVELQKIRNKGDIILIENDLPDIYENLITL